MKRNLLIVSIVVMGVVLLFLVFSLGKLWANRPEDLDIYGAYKEIKTLCIENPDFLSEHLTQVKQSQTYYLEMKKLTTRYVEIVADTFGFDRNEFVSYAIREPDFPKIPDDPGDLGCGPIALTRYTFIASNTTKITDLYDYQYEVMMELSDEMLLLAQRDSLSVYKFKSAVDHFYVKHGKYISE